MIIMCMTTIKIKYGYARSYILFVFYYLPHAATKTMPGKTFLPQLSQSLPKEGK